MIAFFESKTAYIVNLETFNKIANATSASLDGVTIRRNNSTGAEYIKTTFDCKIRQWGNNFIEQSLAANTEIQLTLGTANGFVLIY